MRLSIKNRFCLLHTFLFFLVYVQGCASVERAANIHRYGSSSLPSPTPTEPKDTVGAPEPYGAPPLEEGTVEKVRSKPVILILGPGLAQGFAHVGVIRALIAAKIPIGAIYATEVGGLVAALYGFSTNLNQFEWGLQRFKPDIFLERSGFFSSKNWPSEGVKVEQQLHRVFGKKEIQYSKIPIRIAVESQQTGSILLLDHGCLADAIRSTIAVPGVYSPGTWSDSGATVAATSAQKSRPELIPMLIHEAHSTGIGPVIVVNLRDGNRPQFTEDDLKEADYILNPDISGIGNLDFQKKTEAAFRGQNDVKSHLSEIRKSTTEKGSETRSAYP